MENISISEKMNYPLVSVIMSVYNTRIEYLLEAVNSILNQTYRNFEFIIIDDCSTDYYVDKILDTINDERIMVIRNETNLGLAGSLNKAIDVSNGVYIARMDSDDISLPERLYAQVKYLEKNSNIDVLGTRAGLFGNKKGVRAVISSSSEAIRTNLLFNVGITHPSIMLRKSFLDKNSCRYCLKYRKSQDYKLWCDISDKGGEFYELPQILLNYRISSTQASAAGNNIDQKSNAREIRLTRVHNLGIDPDEKEIQIHNCLSENFYLQGLFDFDDLIKWEDRLISANNISKIYSNKFLKLVMTYNTLSLLKKNKQLFKKSPIQSKITYIAKMNIYLLYPYIHKMILKSNN